MPQTTKSVSNSDPTAVWREWYDNAASVWSNMLGGASEAYLDPFGIYRQWLKSAEERHDHGEPAAPKMDPVELWKSWFDAATGMWRNVAGSGPADPLGLTTQWMEMVEESRAKMLSKEGPPLDPLSFFREWYDKTSQTWSTIVGDVIGTDAFIESASRFFDSYTSYYKTLRQASETQLHNLQIPTRSDVARVAGLVVALEDKVDRLADAVDGTDNRHAQPATAADVSALEQRIARIESRLDALLKAVEGISASSRAVSEQATNGKASPKRAPARRTRRTPPEAGGRAAV